TSDQHLYWTGQDERNTTITNDAGRALVSPYSANNDWVYSSRAPTRAEFRGQVWDAVIHGAKGIMYFPFNFKGSWDTDHGPENATAYDGTPEDPSNNIVEEMKTQNGRLTALGPILLTQENPDQDRYKFDTKPVPVPQLAFEHPSNL